MAKPRLVIAGGTNTDLVVQVPQFPKPGESVMGGVFAKFQGGKGANQAVAAARSGAAVTFIGRVGADDFGKASLDGLEAEGIDVSCVEVDEKLASGVAFIWVDGSGENEIIVAAGANMAISKGQVDRALNAIQSADCVLCQLEMPIDAVCQLALTADRCGRKFILNPAPAPRSPLPEEIYSCVDILLPNQGELETLVGKPLADMDDIESAARGFLQKGVGAVAVTMGREGCCVFTPEESWVTGAFKVNAVDTVGAGDCFAANLTVAIAEGRPLNEAVRFATAASAISVTRLGAQPSMPHRQEIESLLSGN